MSSKDPRNFRRFWAGQTISAIGDAFALVAMPLVVLETTGSVAQMGIVTAVGCAAQIATSLFAGLLVDRANRRQLMIACDIGRALLCVAVTAAARLGHLGLALVYSVTATTAVLGNLFAVSYVTAIPNLVDRADVPRANGRLQATQALAYVVGPVLAGAITSRFGPASAMSADALSFAISAVSLSAVRFRNDRVQARPGTERGLAGLGAGLTFLLRQPTLRASLAISTGAALCSSAGLSAAVIDLFIFRLRHDLHETSQVVGICLGVAALGALAGALLVPSLLRRIGPATCLVAGTALQAFGLIVAGEMASATATGMGAALWAAGLTCRAVPLQSLRQTLTPDALIGRVAAASWTLTFAAATIGAIGAARLAAELGTASALRLTGMALAGIAGVGALIFAPAAPRR